VRALLVSRYPRVDTPAWKRRVAASLVDAGIEVALLYSRSTLADNALAGLREDGLGLVKRYLALRGRAHSGASRTESLAEWARARGLEVLYERRLRDSVDAVRRLDPDLMVLVGADIVPPGLLEVPRLGTINPHYGLLPAFRGMNVTEWSVYRGAPVGVTVHLVDSGIDTGAILLREEVAIDPADTFASLRSKHQDVAARLLVRAALELRDGTARPRGQDLDAGRQYYRMHPALRRVAESRLRSAGRYAGDPGDPSASDASQDSVVRSGDRSS
jgi:methionyl-tRNA formyltransferase